MGISNLLSASGSPFSSMPTDVLVAVCLYIIVGGLLVIGLISFGIAFSKISNRKFVKSSKAVSDFCAEAGTIDDANLEQFEATCFNNGTDPVFLEGWEAFKNARFDYPSVYVDKEKILSRFSPKKLKVSVCMYAGILFGIALVTGVFALLKVTEAYVLPVAIAAMVLPVLLMAAYLLVKPQKKAAIALEQMLDDLDAAVKLQRLVERKVDVSRLQSVKDKIRDVIVSEQSKPIPSKKDQLAAKQRVDEEDIRAELFADDGPAEFVVEEEPAADIIEEAPAVEEPVAPAPKKKVKFEPFVALLNEAWDRNFSTATLRKFGDIIVLAFAKFSEPEQRVALKDSIRKLIASYTAALQRERAEAESTDEVAEEVAATATEPREITPVEYSSNYNEKTAELSDEVPTFSEFGTTPDFVVSTDDDIPEIPD